MKALDARLMRLEHDQPRTLTAEEFFVEVAALGDGWGRLSPDPVAGLSARMPEHELERAIAEIDRLVEEQNRCA